MIYFLRAERDTPDFPAGSIKIGTTQCLTERLKQITRDIGHKPQVLAVMDGGLSEEYVLHQKFSECRIGRVSRGWFTPSDDLWKFIVSEARLWDGTDDDPFEREVTPEGKGDGRQRLIYFIQSKGYSDLIKIGITRNMTDRLKWLIRRYGHGLSVLGVVDGGFADERAIHEKFSFCLNHNEWFDPHPDLIEFIASECMPWDGTDPDPPRR